MSSASLTIADRVPVDLDAEGYGKDEFVHKRDTNHDGSPLVMRLKVEPNDPRGKTHHLKSQERSWHGDAEEFAEAFQEYTPKAAKKEAAKKEAAK